MRIAVSADTKQGLDSVVSPHFGRCPHYILVDVEGHEVADVQEVDSPFYGHHQPGQVPGFIHNLGADVMLAGGMGYRAISFFEQLGIEGVTGAYGTVRHSVERYLGGQLKGAAACKESQQHAQHDLLAESEVEKDALGRLREEAEMLREQLDHVAERLDRMNR
jgi:predicted Fe-Mo cluster-binding NifX family protein